MSRAPPGPCRCPEPILSSEVGFCSDSLGSMGGQWTLRYADRPGMEAEGIRLPEESWWTSEGQGCHFGGRGGGRTSETICHNTGGAVSTGPVRCSPLGLPHRHSLEEGGHEGTLSVGTTPSE